MNVADRVELDDELMLTSAIVSACNAIAPTWPLDRFIAVNPHWGRIDQPFEEVNRTLMRVAKSRLYMPLGYYQDAWQRGEIAREHVLQAAAEHGTSLDLPALVEALDRDEPAPMPLPLLSEVLDSTRDLHHEPAWQNTITQQITQFCAAYFDRDQADWHPDRREGLYLSWRQEMAHDHSVSLLMHAPEIRIRAKDLPTNTDDLFSWAIEKLEIPSEYLEDLFQVVLLRMKGWAAWCAYLRWQARLKGKDDTHLVDLLALRLAWECLLDDGDRSPRSAWAQWRHAWSVARRDEQGGFSEVLAVWQRAQEIAYQRPLVSALRRTAAASPTAVTFQAAFCLDVRSEIFRRALESVHPGAQTIGFAGFFGLPLSYTPIGTDLTRPQLPGLLAPMLNVTDSCGVCDMDQAIANQRRDRLNTQASWEPFHRLPGSAFTLVEALGLGYLNKILRRSFPQAKAKDGLDRTGLDPEHAVRVRPRVVLDGEDGPVQRAALAERVLRTMSLTDDFARLVLFVGHTSQSANNPQAASLDCGACGGQSGEVNARALADLLNDEAVRGVLHGQGIRIPASTHFVPGAHNTMTDTVTIFDRDLVPSSHLGDLAEVERALSEAGTRARAERAPGLGLAHLIGQPEALAKTLMTRANDWAQTRPEWGLANNASFIVAPRGRSRGLDLQGRAFLHDYDHVNDADGSVLEQILTGPMIVAHWINMQYHASTVDNLGFGSGNKVLHNVVGGRIGVFEGNGGDLRIGLSMQSVHDGENWRHAPLRMSLIIDAPRETIEAIAAKHAVVRQLIDNRWLHLFRLEASTVESYRDGRWIERRED